MTKVHPDDKYYPRFGRSDLFPGRWVYTDIECPDCNLTYDDWLIGTCIFYDDDRLVDFSIATGVIDFSDHECKFETNGDGN